MSNALDYLYNIVPNVVYWPSILIKTYVVAFPLKQPVIYVIQESCYFFSFTSCKFPIFYLFLVVKMSK